MSTYWIYKANFLVHLSLITFTTVQQKMQQFVVCKLPTEYNLLKKGPSDHKQSKLLFTSSESALKESIKYAVSAVLCLKMGQFRPFLSISIFSTGHNSTILISLGDAMKAKNWVSDWGRMGSLAQLVEHLYPALIGLCIAVWPDWAIFCTLGKFLKSLATIKLPKSCHILRQFL